MLELPPISLYIHYPWCIKKCPYCDFNSHEGQRHSSYIDALLIDLEKDLHYLQGRSITSIFIGGGTPSLMSCKEILKLMQGIYKKIDLEKNVEITLESNPSSFEADKFSCFKEAGINRISIGVQSFADDNLLNLGRIHSGIEAQNAIKKVIAIGFKNLNIDLMYGLEKQDIKSSIKDVKKAISFNPSHISFYQLTLEKNTVFAKFPPKLPKEDTIWQMYKKNSQLLKNNNYENYEISAFGKKIAKHNINYWQFGDYLGIGAGAHGKITNIKNKEIFRTLKPKSPKDYINNFNKKNNNTKIKAIENINFEFILNATRLKKGFEFELFESRTGNAKETIMKKLEYVKYLELIDINNKGVVPTIKGFNFINDLQQIFL